MSAMIGDVEIRFAPNQTLPPGYRLVWSEGTEHYHWLCAGEASGIYATRWAARRAAWASWQFVEER